MKLTWPLLSVVSLGILSLVFGIVNLARMVVAICYGRVLPDLPMTVSWSYLMVMGALWGAAFVCCGIGLILSRRWARWATLAVVTLYEARVWVDHLAFDASDYARRARLLDLSVTASVLAVYWVVLNLPRIRSRFGREG
jgi:hypothetical protein